MKNEKRIVENLQLKVNALESVVNDVGAYIYAKNLQGNYTFCNKPVLALLHKTLEEVVGKNDMHFFDRKTARQLRNNDQRVMQDNISLETEERIFIEALGSMRIFNAVKKPLHDANGKVIGMCGISRDITEHKRDENIIKEQQKLLAAVLDNVDAHIYMVDCKHVFRYVNRKTAELFNMPADQVVGKKDTELVSQTLADMYWLSNQKVMDTQQTHTVQEHFKNDDGVVSHYQSIKAPYQIDASTPAVIGFSSDITELYELKEQLQEQANTDYLTALNNRRAFIEQAEIEYFRSKRHHLSMAVLTLDIDNFKSINDTYGHPVGDEVLIALSRNLLASVRGEDILARTGGEEFSICLPETNKEKAQVLAERIRATQESQKISGDWLGEILITVSIGIAILEAQDDNFSALFSRADKALYAAKHQGKNRVHCFQ